MDIEPTAGPHRIAMWSGPRNISTAMMRAWESRPDTFVVDEPFYAHYLTQTGLPHPGVEEILRHHPSDADTVTADLLGRTEQDDAGAPLTIFYQKHMAHHLLDGMIGPWLGGLRHAFLIRHPAEMLRSLHRVTPHPTVTDTGLPQQVELLSYVETTFGSAVPILDAKDVLEAPGPMLEALCARLGVAYDPAMLAWRSGPRASDGIWARYWYASVEASESFGPYRPPQGPFPSELSDVLEACMPLYNQLFSRRIEAP